MDDLDALDLATAEFQRRLDLVTDADLARATPCEAWDIRYLVAHVIGGNSFASMVLDGEPSSVAIEHVMSTTLISDLPSDDFARSVVEQRERFRRPGILQQNVDHPIGSIAASRFLRLRISDCAIHAWDLAIALGVDTKLDPDLVAAALDIVRTDSPGMSFGIVARPLDDGADPQVNLLALYGRTSRSSTAGCPE